MSGGRGAFSLDAADVSDGVIIRRVVSGTPA
jgi:hypothetical protein